MNPFKLMGKALKPFVNFPLWMGWQHIRTTTQSLKDLSKSLIQLNKEKVKGKKVPGETFEQVIFRLNLNEEKLLQRKKQFLKLAIFYLILGIALFTYAIHLLITTSHILAAFVTLILSVLMFTYAYRQHFWYFQIKTRKLGQSFKDWAAFTFKGVK